MAAQWNCPPLLLKSILVMFFAGVCLTLQGCGSSSDATTTMPPTTSPLSTTMGPTTSTGMLCSHSFTTTTTTNATMPMRECGTPPDGREIAKLLNKEFYSFDPSNASSGLGVFLRSSEDPNIYCGGACYSPGVADCRISGSMYNSEQMIHRGNRTVTNKSTIAIDFGKRVLWYVNQTQLKQRLGKCSFVWDGGTMGKYNYGCGCNPGITGCDKQGNPYCNMDPATGYTKPNTGKSQDVASCACESRSESSWPTTWAHGPDCFWKGAAYYAPDGYGTDNTWTMLKWRVDHQDYKNGGMDGPKDPVAFWNEVVVDGFELLKSLKEDHFAAMPAIIYTKNVPHARETAESTAMYIAKNYGSCTPATPVPVIAIDANADIASKEDLFFFESSADMDSKLSKTMVV